MQKKKKIIIIIYKVLKFIKKNKNKIIQYENNSFYFSVIYNFKCP